MIRRKGRLALSTTARYRLNSRAELVPAETLRRSGLDLPRTRPGDFVVGVLGARSASLLVSGEVAELLEMFRQPTTLPEAFERLARRRGLDVHAVLEEATESLLELRRQNILELAHHLPQASAGPLFEAGAEPIPGVKILSTVHHLEDSEVFEVELDGGVRGALKIEKRSAGVGSLRREAAALERLGGDVTPELLATGELDQRPWLLRRWVDGCDVLRAGYTARLEDRVLCAGGVRLLTLIQSIARAYATLHHRGILHGDVHGGNVLVDRGGRIRPIDLALARGLGTPLAGEDDLRAGSFFQIEPEQARALLEGRGSVPATPSGEQFAVAALLYEISSGAPYMDLRLDRDGLLRQIADCRPVTFADRGRDAWPGLEAILGRALDPDPNRRFPSMAACADALERLPPQRRRQARRRRLPIVARRGRRRLRLLATVDPAIGPSFYDGAAGAAYALLRISAQLARPAALAAAETWLDEARRRPVDPARRARIGATSTFYCQAGVAVVDALVGHALGDGVRYVEAAANFLATSRNATQSDLLLGRAGSVLAASLLLEVCPQALLEHEVIRQLRRKGDAWAQTLDAEHRRRGPLCQSSYWGMAHGWAGELYALLRWSRVGESILGPQTAERLDELAALARPRGRGRVWPQPGPGPRAGWCHGSAGYVFLWHAAARHPTSRARRSRHFHRLADLAAWGAFEASHENGSLCCGLAGRAWSLLHHARRSGKDIWRHRAAALAESAASAPFPDPPTSLFKGELALVLLDAELRSQVQGFPFLEGHDLHDSSEFDGHLSGGHDDGMC